MYDDAPVRCAPHVPAPRGSLDPPTTRTDLVLITWQ
jgi:hypothetical protein